MIFNMMEEWRPVVGYEGLYEVSNTGRVRSFDRYVKYSNGQIHLHKGKVLSPGKNTKGYLSVVLNCSGKRKTITVHRLVTEAFIPNPDNLPEVNHKDEDKTNNRVENLEWCDRNYNLNYGTARIRSRDTNIKNGYWSGLSKDEYMREYRKENKEKIREKQREYNKKNREKIREQHREYMREYRKKRKEK